MERVGGRQTIPVDIKVVAAKFPDMGEENIEKLSKYLEQEIPQWELNMSLDELLADLDGDETSMGSSPKLNNSPPEIIFASSPTVLIVVDGDPIFEKIEGENYERVVNTPFFLVKDTKKEILFKDDLTRLIGERPFKEEPTKSLPHGFDRDHSE